MCLQKLGIYTVYVTEKQDIEKPKKEYEYINRLNSFQGSGRSKSKEKDLKKQTYTKFNLTQ